MAAARENRSVIDVEEWIGVEVEVGFHVERIDGDTGVLGGSGLAHRVRVRPPTRGQVDPRRSISKRCRG
jgi:hypothetical protein